MIGKTYTLQIRDSNVVMDLREFIHLAGELGNFGVDVELQKDTNPGEIIFRLKETLREQ